MEAAGSNILVVEDHRATRTFLADNLAADGFEILEAESTREARQVIERKFPDLAILDLGLPDGDGLELISYVRDADRVAGRVDPDLPMIILSGRYSEVDKVRGFGRGADDYMPKPFTYPELHARVLALLRRSAGRPGTGRVRIGPLELDTISRQVWVEGESVTLSKKEFALLRALATEPTRVFTREELLREVWGFQAPGSTRTLDSHAARLRGKLNVAGARLVINVWGIGYRLIDGGIVR